MIPRTHLTSAFPIFLLIAAFLHSGVAAQTKATMILPTPSGPYSVGVTSLPLIDNNRVETIDRSGKDRELMIRIWYPAARSTDGSSHYTDNVTAAAMEERFGLPAGFVTRIKTNSVKKAKFADAQFGCPIILLEHGMGMVPDLYSTFGEELASMGFVVVGITHTFTALTTVFPDGRALAYRSPWPTKVEPKVQREAMGKYVSVWVADETFVLNSLEALNKSDKFWRGRLDLSKVGVLGHSYGGTAAGLAHRTDPRIIAGADLDGSIFPGMEQPVMAGVPFLIMTTGATIDLQSEFAGTPGNSYRVTFKDSNHMNFSDVDLLLGAFTAYDSPQTRNALATLDDSKALIDEFFLLYLKGKPAPDLRADVVITRK